MTKKKDDRGPKFVAMIGPVLQAVADLGGSARPQEVYGHVSDALGLKSDAKAGLTPSGIPRHENQMAWARFYLVRDGLLESSTRGVWTLTEKGRERVPLSHAQSLELFQRVRAAFPKPARMPAIPAESLNDGSDQAVPDDEAADPISSDHRARVLELLQALTPSGFERFCQRLLREADFQNVIVTGRAGDGGIDGTGVLRVNTLVSFKVLFQCKRYLGSVVASQVRDFRGAMMGRADKGIILTTGGFTADARKEAVRDGVPPIELVDGEMLVGMLEEFEIGLVPVPAFRVDEPFFLSFSSVLGEASDGSAR